MSQVVAGRIFWKEWRTQRLFWIGVLALSVGLQLLSGSLIGLMFHMVPGEEHRWQGIIAFVLPCCFAIGSAAIAFAGEVEGRTKGALQGVPIRPRDILLGKLCVSIVGSYALMLALWGTSSFLAGAATPPEFPFRSLHFVGDRSVVLLGPFLVVVVGLFVSLALADVLLTVVVTAAVAAGLLAMPAFHYPGMLGILIVSVAIGDQLLTGRWLRGRIVPSIVFKYSTTPGGRGSAEPQTAAKRTKTAQQELRPPISQQTVSRAVAPIERPALSAVEGPALSAVEGPALSAVEGPALSAVEGPALSAVEGPALSAVEGPALSAVEGPALSAVEGPALSAVEGPALSAVEGPALSAVEGPALSAVEGPALSAVEGARSSIVWLRNASSLVWKEWRQAWPFGLKLLAVELAAICGIALLNKFGSTDAQNFQILPIFLLLIAPVLPGVAAMTADRKNNAFRLMANCGISVNAFWIWKNLVWLATSTIVTTILVAAGYFVAFQAGLVPAPGELWSGWYELRALGFESLGDWGPFVLAGYYVLLLYSLGLLAALVLRGTVPAIFLACFVWAGLISLGSFLARLEVPFWYTIGPLPLIVLVTHRIRTADWLTGRNTWRAWGKAAAVPIAGLFVLLAATIVFRVTEIPAVAIPEQVVESRTAAISPPLENESPFVAAVRMIAGPDPTRERGIADDRVVMFVPDGSQPARVAADGWQYATVAERQWVAANGPACAKALEALKEPPGRFPPQRLLAPLAVAKSGQPTQDSPWWSYSSWSALRPLRHLLLLSARRLESENRLDDALRCYLAAARVGSDFTRACGAEMWAYRGAARSEALEWMQHWAARPPQSTTRVVAAIRQFEQLDEADAPVSAELIESWRRERGRVWQRLWHGTERDPAARTVAELRWTRWLLPWELWRLERLQDAEFAATLELIRGIEADLHQHGYLAEHDEEDISSWNHGGLPWRYERTTLGIPADAIDMLLLGPEPKRLVDQAAVDRMSLLALGIADYRRTHSKLPESLDELVPTYFPRLPVNPWNGRPFHYHPRGISIVVPYANDRISRGTPFLACFAGRDAGGPAIPLRR